VLLTHVLISIGAVVNVGVFIAANIGVGSLLAVLAQGRLASCGHCQTQFVSGGAGIREMGHCIVWG
jgi:hypothetical protein